METRKRSTTIRVKEDGARVSIPTEILMDILSRLSIKNIFKCRLVRKEWLQILLSDVFAKLHFSRAPTCPLLYNPNGKVISKVLYLLEIERDRHTKKPGGDMKISTRFLVPNPYSNSHKGNLSVVNSCKGLLCLHDSLFENHIVIYNPVTREYTIIPRPTIEDESPNCFVVGGLGFCPRINKFKLLVILPGKSLVLVYTLGSGIWRTVGNAPPAIRIEFANTTFFNGALHWLVGDNGFVNSLILYFDLDDERFKPILPPCTMNPDYQMEPDHVDKVLQSNYLQWSTYQFWGRKKKCFGVLRDQIFVCETGLESQPDVWAQKDYGNQQSWFKEFEFPSLPQGLYHPIEFLEDGDLLLHHDNNAFVTCDRYNFRYFKIQGFRTKFQVTPHIPSFVSLKEVVGDTMEVLTVRPSESQVTTSQLHLVEENRECKSG